MKLHKIIFPALFLLLFAACNDKDEIRSSEKEIVSFIVNGNPATINETGKLITLTLASGAQLEKLKPVIEVSEKATVFPASDAEQDFTQPVTYTVQAEDGSKEQYTVIITREKSSSAEILNFSIGDFKGVIKSNWSPTNVTEPNNVSIRITGITDVTRLRPEIQVSAGAKISPSSGIETDFTKPVRYTVTAENGYKNTYTVGVKTDAYPSGLMYLTSFRNSNKTQDVTTSYKFLFDYANRPVYFSYTTKPFYIDDSLVDGNIVYLKYGDNDKINQIIFGEKENNLVKKSRAFDVSYPDSKTIYAIEKANEAENQKDVITIDEKGRVSAFESNGKTQTFEYDASGNLVKSITEDGYKVMTYDHYNAAFSHFNAPRWTLLYTTGELIGSGPNNVLSIKTYKSNGELMDEIDFDYKYDSQTRYPKTYSYKKGNETFGGVLFFSYEFPFTYTSVHE